MRTYFPVFFSSLSFTLAANNILLHYLLQIVYGVRCSMFYGRFYLNTMLGVVLNASFVHPSFSPNTIDICDPNDLLLLRSFPDFVGKISSVPKNRR